MLVLISCSLLTYYEVPLLRAVSDNDDLPQSDSLGDQPTSTIDTPSHRSSAHLLLDLRRAPIRRRLLTRPLPSAQRTLLQLTIATDLSRLFSTLRIFLLSGIVHSAEILIITIGLSAAYDAGGVVVVVVVDHEVVVVDVAVEVVEQRGLDEEGDGGTDPYPLFF